MPFVKATKESCKLRLDIFGPSGSGKTYTMLRMATGIASVTKGRIAVIDSERGRSNKYADKFDFGISILEDRIAKGYINEINDAAKNNIDVLCIDSLSHEWMELISEVDRIAKARYRNNTWGAWSEGTPIQRSFIDAIVNFPGHIISTMRSDTEWSVEKDEHSGKSKPIRLGLKPQQGKGIEYEFDMLMELSQDHFGTIIKDITGKFQDQIIEKPGEQLGIDLANWLSEGVAPSVKIDRPVVANFKRIVKEKNCPQVIDEMLKVFGVSSIEQISDENIGKVINKIQLEEGKAKLDAVVNQVKTNVKDDEVF